MPQPPEYFISCDWGTTNFRLSVVRSASVEVVAQQLSDQGIRDTYDKFRLSGQSDQFAFFARYLSDRLRTFPDEFRNCPVVASGMASANIGLKALPYAALPIDESGSRLVTEWLQLKDDRRLLLISGIAGPDSIMRGEEVQAMGLIPHLAEYGDGTLVLPGTHSKHLRFEGGTFTSFATYMTGELFEVLSRRSILANSVTQGPLEPDAAAAFMDGLHLGAAGRISRSLFTVRVRDVVGKTPAVENYYFLSGLLIGEELRELPGTSGMVYVVAPEPILNLYRMALENLVEPGRLICYGEHLLERARLYGQLKLLLRHG